MKTAKEKMALPKNGGAIMPSGNGMPDNPDPPTASIDKAKGGFLVRLRGGKAKWSDPPIVCKTLDECYTHIEEHLGKGEGSKDDKGKDAKAKTDSKAAGDEGYSET